MNFLQAVFFGFLQGLTEFLPISSSAHIRIFGELIGIADPGAAFTAIIQIGTELAVLVYFRKTIFNIIASWFCCLFAIKKDGYDSYVGNVKSRADVMSSGGKYTLSPETLRELSNLNGESNVPETEEETKTLSARFGKYNFNARMGWLIILGSLPIVILGVCFQDQIETALRNLWITATMLIVFGIVLLIADNTAKQKKSIVDMNFASTMVFGIGQSLALIPGVSRSGGSISFGLFAGFTRETAARYSFLLAMPAVFGSGFFELIKALHGGIEGTFPGWGATIIATIISFVVGYLVIIAFLKIVSTYSYKPFVIYRIIIGLCVMGMLAMGIIHAV